MSFGPLKIQLDIELTIHLDHANPQPPYCNKNWWPAGANIEFDFIKNRYASDAQPRTQEALFLVSRASEGWALDEDNVWQSFAPGLLRRTTKGLLLEEERTNKSVNYNATPTDLTGVNLSGNSDPAAALTIVDDSVELANAGLQNICASGLVYKLDNSAGVLPAYFDISGSTGNTNPAVLSAYFRVVGGSGTRIQVTGGSSGATGYKTNPEYARYSVTTTPINGNAAIRIYSLAGSITYLILNQIEEGDFASSPIVVSGAEATRKPDNLELTSLARQAIDPLAGTFVAKTDAISDDSAVYNRMIGLINAISPITRQTSNIVSSWNGADSLQATLGGATTFNDPVASVSAYDASGRSLVANFGTVATDANLITAEVNGFNRIFVGVRMGTQNHLNGYVRGITYYPTRLSDTEIRNLSFPPNKSQAKSVHLLGDSFATQAQLDAISTALDDSSRIYTRDGVGGRTMANNALSYAGTPDYYGRTLLIWDGSGDTVANTIAGIDSIAGNITNPKWAYIEPDGQMNDADLLTVIAHIESTYGTVHYIPTLSFLQANNDGSPEDLIDIAAGQVPRSLRSDVIHLNSTGQNLLANGPIRDWVLNA